MFSTIAMYNNYGSSVKGPHGSRGHGRSNPFQNNSGGRTKQKKILEVKLIPHLLEVMVAATLALLVFGVLDPTTRLRVVVLLMKMLDNTKLLLLIMLVTQLMKLGTLTLVQINT